MYRGRPPGSKNRNCKPWQEKFPDRVTDDLYINMSKFKARLYDAPNGECQYMTGAKHPQGYPMIPGYKKSTEKCGMHTGHRVMYQIHHGAIPAGQNVIHTCLSMQCVNPDHLFLGTPKDRGELMVELGHTTLGRANTHPPKKQANRKYRYTEDEIRLVRHGSIADIMKHFGWSEKKAKGKKYAWTYEGYQWLKD